MKFRESSVSSSEGVAQIENEWDSLYNSKLKVPSFFDSVELRSKGHNKNDFEIKVELPSKIPYLIYFCDLDRILPRSYESSNCTRWPGLFG